MGEHSHNYNRWDHPQPLACSHQQEEEEIVAGSSPLHSGDRLYDGSRARSTRNDALTPSTLPQNSTSQPGGGFHLIGDGNIFGADAAMTGSFTPPPIIASEDRSKYPQGCYTTPSDSSTVNNPTHMTNTFKNGKQKMWGMSPNPADPKVKRIHKAATSHRNREQKKKKEYQLQKDLAEAVDESRSLQKEKCKLQHSIQELTSRQHVPLSSLEHQQLAYHSPDQGPYNGHEDFSSKQN